MFTTGLPKMRYDRSDTQIKPNHNPKPANLLNLNAGPKPNPRKMENKTRNEGQCPT